MRAIPLDDGGPVGSWLAARGLGAWRRFQVGWLSVGRASFADDEGLWEPYPEGEAAIVAPAWPGFAADGLDEDIDPIDLIAWRPAQPERLYRRTGEAVFLGAGAIGLAAATDQPLWVYRSVEGFVRRGGELGCAEPPAGTAHGALVRYQPACVLLDIRAAGPALRQVPRIVAEDLALAEAIEKSVHAALPAMPDIRVAVAERRAA